MKLLKIMGYLKRYWYVAILPPLFMLGEVYFLLLIPRTSGNIIDVGITDQNLPKVIEMSLMMLLFTTLSVVFGYLSQYFSNVASNEVANDLRIETFTKSLNMSFTNLDEFQVGKVITRVTSDTNIIRMMIRTILRTFLRAPILIFGAIFMVVTLSPKLAITLLVAIPFMFIANYIIIKKSFPKFRLVQEKLENINTFTQENLENIRVVKAFNRKEYVIDKFDEYINELQDTTIKANIITSLNSPIFQFVTNFCVVAVIYIGGLDVIADKYNAGNIIAFLGYLSQIMMALNLISGLILEFPRAGASANRLYELFEVQSEIKNSANPIKDVEIKGKIEFRNVTFAYKGQEEPILKNVSFKIDSGQVLGILGTTGSGKTTLINLIPRFYDVTEGEILIDDINVKDYDLYTLRSQISTVMQKALLFAGTIADNIKFGRMSATDDEVDKASKAAEAYEFIEGFPEGYDTILGERGINLSGGQKQRLSLARSLLVKPKILILDDSTSAVDMATEQRILKAFRQDVTDCTKIIIAQRIRSVLSADKILILEDGRVTGYGTHEELLKSNKFYQTLYNQQMGGSNDEKQAG